MVTMLWHVSSLLVGPNDKLLSSTPAQSLPAPFPFRGDTSIFTKKEKKKIIKDPNDVSSFGTFHARCGP